MSLYSRLSISIFIFALWCGFGVQPGGQVADSSRPTANRNGSPPVVTKYKTTFPRLASHDIGDKNYDKADYQAVLARFDFTLLGFYKGWHGGPAAMRAAVRAIKSRNPAIIAANKRFPLSSRAAFQLSFARTSFGRSRVNLDPQDKAGGSRRVVRHA